MKTITMSLAALHKNTAKIVRRTLTTGDTLALTDRGETIAYIQPVMKIDRLVVPKINWADRKLLPGYVKAMNEGKLKSTGDSTLYISQDRSSRDDSVAGLETFDPVVKRKKRKR